jgi:PAS domain S-box-containing protein
MSDHVIFYEKDDMIIKWCNRAAADSVEMKPDDLVGKKCHEIWHNSNEPCSFCPVREAYTTKEHIEKEVKTPDGRVWLVRGQPMVNKDNIIIGAIEITRDITEKVKSNYALRESEEKYRTIVKSMEDIVFRFDKDDKYVEYYAADEALLIVPPDEFLNKHVGEVLPSKIADLFIKHSKYVRDTSNSATFDYPLHLRDHVYWFSATFSLHEDGESIVAVVRDISERKLAEEALQESEEKFREIFEESPVGIQLYDSDARLIKANKASLKMAGVNAVDDLIGFDLYADVHTSDEIKEKLRARLPVRYEAVVDFATVKEHGYYKTRRSGEIHLDCQLTPLGINADGEFRGYLLQLLDITDRKKADVKLRDSHRDLELYAYLLRHDLGNDLQIILAEAENALLAYSDNPQVKDLSEVVMASAERMTRVLVFFGLEDTSFEQRIIPVLERCATQARKAHSGLVVRVHADNENRRLRVNAGRMLTMVFDNIFRNSAEYAGPNPEVDVTVKPSGECLLIDIVDNGPGIPQEIKENLFEKRPEGGMGLILIKRVLEIYNGSIELVEMEPDQGGTAFQVKLPRV